MFIYYLFIFLSFTPYQYTYLNKFIGNFSYAHQKFENDYWAISVKELIKKIKNKTLNKNKKVPKIILEAQSDKLHFYVNHGYKIEGDKYLMDGIYHTKMFKKF